MNFSFEWPLSLAGQTVYLPCPCVQTQNAARVCLSGGIWSEPDLSGCTGLTQEQSVCFVVSMVHFLL